MTVEKMAQTITTHLKLTTKPMVSAIQFIIFFHKLFLNVANQLELEEFFIANINLEEMKHKLLVLISDNDLHATPSSEVALVFICFEIYNKIKEQNKSDVVNFDIFRFYGNLYIDFPDAFMYSAFDFIKERLEQCK